MRWYYDTEFNDDGRTIDLISIALVSEDGREYYAVSTEFDADRCNDWVKKNVFTKLPPRSGGEWKSRAQIARDIKTLLVVPDRRHGPHNGQALPVQLWAYFAAYDHVALAQLWGAMVDLPTGMPMHTMDIKQEMVRLKLRREHLPVQQGSEHSALDDARWVKQAHEWLLRYEASL
jgi:hypothetical protein